MTPLIQALSPDNTGMLYELYQSVYGGKRAAGYYERKYAAVYPEHPPVGFLAFEEGGNSSRRIIGFYGALPCYLFSGDACVPAAQCADAMTHPAFRRKGLFLILARLTMNACEQSGIKMLFGFPNQHSLPGFLDKLGWQRAGQLDCFRVPVTALPIGKIFRRLMFTVSVYELYSNYVIRRLIRKDARLATVRDVESGLHRDRLWMENKRLGGMHLVPVAGNTCWLRIGEDLLIGDLTGDAGCLNLKVIKKLARRLGLPAVQLHCSPGTALHEALRAQIPALPSFTIVVKDFGSGIRAGDLKFTLADIDTF